MAKVKQTFTGDASQLKREYDKLLQGQVKLEEQMRQVTAEARKTGKNQFSGFNKGAKAAVKNLASMAAGYFSIQGAIQLLNAELEKKRQLEDGARVAALRVADAESQVIKNIGISNPDVDKDVVQRFINDVKGIQADTGFQSAAPLLNAAAATLSATGGDLKRTVGILRSSAPLFKDEPEALVEAASRIGDVIDASGANAKDSTGLILSAMSQFRIINLKQLSQVAPAIKGAVKTQANVDPKQAAREAAAAFAAIGNQAGDAEGAVTKTAVIGLAGALKRNFEIDQQKFEQLRSQGVGIADARKQSALSFVQRLDLAQATGERIADAINKGIQPAESDAATMKDLLSKGFEGQTLEPVKDLLAGNNTASAKAFDSALAKISFDGSSVDKIAELLRNATQNLAIADNQRNLEGAIEGAQTKGALATIGEIRSQMNRAFDTTGHEIFGSVIGQFIENRVMDFSGSTVKGRADAAIGSLRTRLKSIETELHFGADEPITKRSQDSFSESENEERGILREAIKNIERLAVAFEANQNPVAVAPVNGARQQGRGQVERD